MWNFVFVCIYIGKVILFNSQHYFQPSLLTHAVLVLSSFLRPAIPDCFGLIWETKKTPSLWLQKSAAAERTQSNDFRGVFWWGEDGGGDLFGWRKEPALNDRKGARCRAPCSGRTDPGKALYTQHSHTSKQYIWVLLHDDAAPHREAEHGEEHDAPPACMDTESERERERRRGRGEERLSFSLLLCVRLHVCECIFHFFEKIPLTPISSDCDSRAPPMGEPWQFQHQVRALFTQVETFNNRNTQRKTDSDPNMVHLSTFTLSWSK